MRVLISSHRLFSVPPQSTCHRPRSSFFGSVCRSLWQTNADLNRVGWDDLRPESWKPGCLENKQTNKRNGTEINYRLDVPQGRIGAGRRKPTPGAEEFTLGLPGEPRRPKEPKNGLGPLEGTQEGRLKGGPGVFPFLKGSFRGPTLGGAKGPRLGRGVGLLPRVLRINGILPRVSSAEIQFPFCELPPGRLALLGLEKRLKPDTIKKVGLGTPLTRLVLTQTRG